MLVLYTNTIPCKPTVMIIFQYTSITFSTVVHTRQFITLTNLAILELNLRILKELGKIVVLVDCLLGLGLEYRTVLGNLVFNLLSDPNVQTPAYCT